MPIFVASDLMFPHYGDALRRFTECKNAIQFTLSEQTAPPGRRWTVVIENEVDAFNCLWRLFQSHGQLAALHGIEKSQVGLVLVGHNRLRFFQRDCAREKWHRKLLRALISQWPTAFICMVGRGGRTMDNIRIAESQLM